MILIAVIFVLIVFFLATRYGFKAESKFVRLISYVGAFLAIALLTMLLVLIIGEKIQN